MPRVRRCTCEKAARINSTLAVKALAWIEARDPEAAQTLADEAKAHAERLTRECPCGRMTWPPCPA